MTGMQTLSPALIEALLNLVMFAGALYALIHWAYPTLEQKLGLQRRVARLVDAADSRGRWKRLAWLQPILRQAALNAASNMAAQILLAVILLPALTALLASLWLYRSVPMFWSFLVEQLPWLAGGQKHIVVLLGALVFVVGYRVREAYAQVYGSVEIGISLAALYLVGSLPSFSEGLLPFATAAYIGVRGLDNISRGRKAAEVRPRARDASLAA